MRKENAFEIVFYIFAGIRKPYAYNQIISQLMRKENTFTDEARLRNSLRHLAIQASSHLLTIETSPVPPSQC
jgi:hypothetical protein